jgi:hypothetical protein
MYNHYNAASPILLSIYFTLVVLMGSFFVLNLMLAAIWSTFNKEHDEDAAEYAMVILPPDPVPVECGD